MEQNDLQNYRGGKDSRIWSGLILVAAGLLLLAYKLGAPIPSWVFTWPVLLIAIGFLTGVKSKFHNPGSFIMIVVGAVFLVDQSIPGIDFHNYIVPVILIGIGLVFIMRPRHHPFNKDRDYWKDSDRWRRRDSRRERGSNNFTSENISMADNAEYIDIHAVFGGVKKNILSKNFKGGEIVSFMGGTEINFMQADIQHPVVLEVNNVFGGTKLIIPSNWDLKNEVTAVFGGIEDKRSFNNITPENNKTILLKGACVFGGIEITNY